MHETHRPAGLFHPLRPEPQSSGNIGGTGRFW